MFILYLVHNYFYNNTIKFSNIYHFENILFQFSYIANKFTYQLYIQ